MRILLLLLFLFVSRSRPTFRSWTHRQQVYWCGPKTSCIGRDCGSLFNLPLIRFLQERCPLESQGVSPRTYMRKWHWVAKGWTMADTGFIAQTPLREWRAYSHGRWKCCQHMILSCQHSSRQAGLKRIASPKVMSFPRALPAPLMPTWDNLEVPLSLQSSPGSWLMLNY